MKLSTGAAVRDHRNAVRDRSESLSAFNRIAVRNKADSFVAEMAQREPSDSDDQNFGHVAAMTESAAAQRVKPLGPNTIGSHMLYTELRHGFFRKRSNAFSVLSLT